MKKFFLLFIIVFATLTINAQTTSTNLVFQDYYDKFVFYDSASLDTLHFAPVTIYKGDYEIKPKNKLGGRVLLKTSYGRYLFDHNKINGLSGNDTVRMWLEKSFDREYRNAYQYDGSNNLIEHRRYFVIGSDTTYTQFKDTLIYGGSNLSIKYPVADDSTL